MPTLIEDYAADHKFLVDAAAKAANISDPVPFNPRGHLHSLLLKGVRGPLMPIGETLLRDWITGGRTYWAGTQFGVRVYTAGGITFAGILRFTDSLGLTRVDIGASATTPSRAGLWVGDAQVDQVSQYLKPYVKSTNVAQFHQKLNDLGLTVGGSGIPVLYLNGQFATQGYWRRVITELGPQWRHITYDERARGRKSEIQLTPYSQPIRPRCTAPAARALRPLAAIGSICPANLTGFTGLSARSRISPSGRG